MGVFNSIGKMVTSLGMGGKSQPVTSASAGAGTGKATQPQTESEELSDGELVSFVKNEFTRRQNERRPFELQWRLNLAFIEGNQYVDVVEGSNELQEVLTLWDGQQREVYNHVAPILETRIARLTRMHPILKTRPGSGDFEDLKAAKTSSNLLKHVQHDKNIKAKLAGLVGWSEPCGTAIIKNVWNPNLGKVIMQEQTSSVNEEGIEEQVTSNIYEGDLEPIVIPPQEFFPDSCFRQDIKDCRSVIHARAIHTEEIKETWGVDVAPETVSVVQLSRSMNGGIGYGLKTGSYNHATVELKQHALVLEYWERPTKKYPEGRLISVAGDKKLYSGTNPYRVGDDSKPDLPFAKLVSIERPGVFWGKSVVERLIPLQRRYNAMRNRKAEYMNRVAIGVWLIEEDAVDMTSLEADLGTAGSIISYRKGFAKPEMLQVPSLPASFEAEMAALLEEFNQISGVSELSRQSKADSGLKSGVALSIALEQDDTRLNATAVNIETFMVEAGKQWLRLYKQFAEIPRVLRMIGKNNTLEVEYWTGNDIQADDVIVEPYSALAESPAQRRQMIYEFLQTGLFNDPETGRPSREMQSKIFEMLEFGNWEDGNDSTEIHTSKAERENKAMEDGKFVKPVEYDDHMLHIGVHNKHRLTAEYEALMEQNPALEGLYASHVELHQQFMLGAQMDAANQQAQAQQGLQNQMSQLAGMDQMLQGGGSGDPAVGQHPQAAGAATSGQAAAPPPGAIM